MSAGEKTQPTGPTAVRESNAADDGSLRQASPSVASTRCCCWPVRQGRCESREKRKRGLQRGDVKISDLRGSERREKRAPTRDRRDALRGSKTERPLASGIAKPQQVSGHRVPRMHRTRIYTPSRIIMNRLEISATYVRVHLHGKTRAKRPCHRTLSVRKALQRLRRALPSFSYVFLCCVCRASVLNTDYPSPERQRKKLAHARTLAFASPDMFSP